MKAIVWLGSSKKDLATFPAEVQRRVGHQLQKVQYGGEPSSWKPMSTIGASVRELGIREQSGSYRVVYVATQPEAVYVLHCFQKKAQRTRRAELDVARTRFCAMARNARKG